MHLNLSVGKERDVALVVRALERAGITVEVVVETSWPNALELVVADAFDVNRVLAALDVTSIALCPDEVAIALRVTRVSWEQDLLYYIPCSDWAAALQSLPADVDAYTDARDGFRNWFRGQWIGSNEEWELTVKELSAEPLTAEKILSVIDPDEWRDWRDVHSYIHRHAPCGVLAQAMSFARTGTQKSRLAYVFHRRRRPCAAVIPHLAAWLNDDDQDVREEASDSLGRVVSLVRQPTRRREFGDLAGEALLEYVQRHPDDNLYWARVSLGATGYEPARPYLEEVVRTSSGARRESALQGLRNLDLSRMPTSEMRYTGRARRGRVGLAGLRG